MVLKKRYLLLILLLGSIILTSCGVENNQALLFPSSLEEDIKPTSFPTPSQEKVLSVCLGDEPTSLFIYGDLSRSANIIRQAIYDGPIDRVDFQSSSPLLTELPSQENGLVTVNQVEVFPGERIIDANGNLTILTDGVEYRSSGCLYPECWQVYNGQDPVIMDQVEVKFIFETGSSWSDGATLTAQDSIFSYQIAQEIYGTAGPPKQRFSSKYELIDQQSILWTGIPGYLGIYDYAELFFTPLPEHSLGGLTALEILSMDNISQQLLGWGPYKITEWSRGDHLTLQKNELFARAGEGLPVYDALVFRFVSDGVEALAAFSSGECGIVLNEPDLFNFLPEITIMEEEGDVKLSFYDSSAWEQISFGVNSLNSKQNLVSDPITRRAIAECIDREEISASRGNAGAIVDGFYQNNDPHNNLDVGIIAYQPNQAVEKMKEVGWIDHDNDSETPLISAGVENIPDGSAFQLSLLVTGADEIPPTATKIKDQLKGCGIEVLIETLSAAELLAPGPVGPVFGRRFDMALFAWSSGNYHLCRIFHTDEIPGQYPSYAKGWGGANAPGYSVHTFDDSCDILTTSLPDSVDNQDALTAVQNTFAEDLPVLPLFYRQELIISYSEYEGVRSGNYSPFWNIEEIR